MRFVAPASAAVTAELEQQWKAAFRQNGNENGRNARAFRPSRLRDVHPLMLL